MLGWVSLTISSPGSLRKFINLYLTKKGKKMSNYNSLKTTIDANIKQNGRQEITGQILNSVLNQMVTTLGAGYQFAGVATTATNPGSPDAKVFYIANGKGTYTNFGGINVTEDEVVVLYWDTTWHKEATGIASQEKLTELERKFEVFNVSDEYPTGGTGGTNVYTVPNARAAVPVEYRRSGQIIMYRTQRGWIQEQFVGEDVAYWETYESLVATKLYRRITLFEDKNKNIGGYISAQTGNIVSDAELVGFSYSDYIELDFSSVLFTHVAKRSDLAYMAIYDASKAMVHTFVYNSTDIPNPDDQAFWVADILAQYPNARYVRFCAYTKDEIFIQGNNLTNINNSITSVEKRVNESLTLWKRGNIVSDSSIEAYKGYQNSSGGINGFGTDSNWFNTQFIDVKPNTIISVSSLSGQETDVMTVGFFDANKACLTDISIRESIGDAGRDISVNDERIRYVRFSGSYYDWFSQTATIVMTYPSGISVPDAIESMETSIDNNTEDIVSLDKRVTAIEESGQSGIKYDIEHFISYGQSLSQGDWEPHIVTYAQKYNSLMFTGTPRVWEYRDQANKYDALIPAVENVFQYQSGETVVGANYRGETPCCGAAEKATEMIIADGFDIDNYQFQMLVSAPGMGGYSIARLSKGTAVYSRLLDDVTNGKRLANASGKSYACRGVMWIQGETDNGQTFEYYYNAMKKLFEDLNTDIKNITGQVEDVHFFLYQTRCYDWYYQGFHYPEIPLAQYQICRDMRNVHFVGPIYHLPLIDDYTHFTAEGSKWYGGYMGRAWKKVIIDRENWDGIYLKSHIVYGNYIELTFGVPVLPLVFDTTNVVDRGVGKGFQIRNVDDFAQNSYLDIITNVQIIRPDTVRITCSQSPSGKRLTYAINGTATPSLRADMGSGNLRDSSTDVFNFPIEENGADIEHKMYNWCPLFDLVLE